MTSNPLNRHSRIAAAVLLVFQLPAMAQQSAATPAPLERVVVTGSNIKRISAETALPVQVLSREDISATGAMNLTQLLEVLTNNDRSAISDLGGANSWASGASSISLRNLGTGGTLVLVNGRRIASFGFADGLKLNFTNTDSIPSAIIERVEILKDGASAIYGSEAIGGVVNIITRRNFQGGVVSAFNKQSLKNSVLDNEQNAALTYGYGDLATQGFNVYGHVELFKRHNYKDREIRGLLPDWFIAFNPDRDQQSTGSFPGNYVGRYPSNFPDPALRGQRISAAAPGCKAENLRDGLCWYDYWKDSDARPGTERMLLLAGGRLRLSDDHQLYFEANASRIEPKYYTSIPRSNVTGNELTWYDSIKGELQRFVDPQLPAGHPNNPYSFPIGLNYRFVDHPDMFKNESPNEDYRVLAGLEGSFRGWDYDMAAGLMGSRAAQQQRLYRDRFGYTEAIVSGEYKFGQQNPRALLDKMFPEMGSNGRYKQAFVDLKASGSIGRLPGGEVMMAAGAELRREDFFHRSSDNVLAARIVQFSGVSLSGDRSTAAVFSEVELPVSKHLKLTAALRGDKDLDGFGAVTPKLSAAFRPNEQLLLRGTVTQGFRAPSLPETGNGGASWFNYGLEDPKRCAIADKMWEILDKGTATDKQLANRVYSSGCDHTAPTRVSPNPELKPEYSNSITAGIVLQPTRELTVSLDYYKIDRKDEISLRSLAKILEAEDQNPGLVTRGAVSADDIEAARRVKELSGQTLAFSAGPIQGLANRYANLTRTKVSGIDLDLRSRWSLGSLGRLDAGLEANYQIDYRDWNMDDNRFNQSYVGYRGTPRLRAVTKLGWSKGSWRVGARINYSSRTALAWGAEDTGNYLAGCKTRGIDAAECLHIKQTTTTDLSFSYSGIKNLTLMGNLYNAFNQQRPAEYRAGTALPLWGRVLRVGAEYRF
jgi:iron complex outermembrane receptor protein